MKKEIRRIVFSTLTALSFGALGIGTTFALFTSESKTTLNIQSGRVEIGAQLVGIKTYSATYDPDGSILDENDVHYRHELQGTEVVGGVTHYLFANKGYATFVDDTVTVKNITPGDKLQFGYDLSHNSNVSVKYRFVYSVVESNAVDRLDLVKGLTTTIKQGDADAESYQGLIKYASAWTLVNPTDELDDLLFTIELPMMKGNNYQNKTADIVIQLEEVQANAYLPEGFQLETIAEDLVDQQATVEGEALTLVTSNNDVQATVTIPANEEGVTDASENDVKVVISDLIVNKDVGEAESALNFDVSLYVNDEPKESFDQEILVELDVGQNMGIISVKHNGTEITDYTYDPAEGIIRFTTTSFSPFEVVYFDLPNTPVRIGKVGYASLAEALITLKSTGEIEGTNTIIVQSDHASDLPSGSAGRIGPAQGVLTIDLNGHEVILNGNGRLQATGSGTLNIKSGVEAKGTLRINSSQSIACYNSGRATFNNVHLIRGGAIINPSDSASLLVEDSIFESTSVYSAAVSFGTSGSVELIGSKFIGGPAVQVSSNTSGHVLIDGCELIGANTSILTVQNSSSTEPLIIRNSSLSVMENRSLQVGMYLQSNAKVINVDNCVLDMGNSTHTNQYAIRLTSEGVSTINVTNSTIRNVVGYGICMDMDGYGDATFTNTSISTSKQTVEMDHANGHVTFNAGCNIVTQNSSIYYTVKGSMVTLNPGVTLNINPGESNNKFTINGNVVDNGDGTWSIVKNLYHVTADNSDNYVLDEHGVKTQLTASWSDIIGDGDEGDVWTENPSTHIWEKPQSHGIAGEGDTVYFENGVYYVSGHLYAPHGVTLIGESKEGVFIGEDGSSAECDINANGDLTVKNMTFLGSKKVYSITPNVQGLSSESNPTREAALLSYEANFVIENCNFRLRTNFTEKMYAINFPSYNGNLTVRNCHFNVGPNGIGLCGLRTHGGDRFIIEGNTFENCGSAIDYVGENFAENQTALWTEANTLINSPINRF